MIADVTIEIWYHVIITWDLNGAYIYKNGCLDNTANGISKTYTENSVYNDIYLGCSNKRMMKFRSGFLDDMYIIDYLLNSQDTFSFYLDSLIINCLVRMHRLSTILK